MNEDDTAFLLTGSSEGAVRIYKCYENSKDITLLSSWRALTDMIPSNRSSGLVAEWQQGRGSLLVGGDVKVIRIWDALREVCHMDIPARSGSCITSLTSDQVAGNIFVAGFGDGAVRIYDRRLKPWVAMVRAWKEHKSWICGVHMQRGGLRELVSGAISGDVKLWDIRASQSLKTVEAHDSQMRAMVVHEHAPVFATGNADQLVKVWNMNGTQLSSFRPHTGFLSHRSSTSSHHFTALAFHPHEMALACSGGGDCSVNIMSPQRTETMSR